MPPPLTPLAAETMLFFNEGPTLIVVSPAWAALVPLIDTTASERKAGIYIDGAGNATAYKYNVKKLLKIPDLQKALSADLGTRRANRVVPSPTGPLVTSTQNAKLTLSFKLPAGAAKDVSNTLVPLDTGGLPYALRFGPGTQALVTTSGLKVKLGAKLKLPKTQAKKITLPATYTLYFVTSGSVAVVCGQGFCGSLQTEDPTATGCAAALVGQYGSGLGLRTPCSLCKDAGFKAYSNKPAAPACAVCTGPLAANSAGTGCGNLVATSSSLSIDPATCTPQLINDTASAYADFLKAQPEVIPETVVVTVTCLQVGTGVSLTIAATWQGSSASTSNSLNLFTQCCPSPGGAACAGTPCDSPLLKPLNITGGQGQAGAVDPCLAQPCNINGADCAAQKGEPSFVCTCKPGYANVFGTTCSECAGGYFIQSGGAGDKDVVCASKCVQTPPYCNPNGTTTCTTANPPTCACKANYSGPTCSTCAPNFFPTADGAGVVCSQCAPQCASCATNATNCITCSGANFAAPGCTTCLSGFYKNAGGNCVSALYNTFPETGRLSGSYQSLGFEATQTYGVGQKITLKQAGIATKFSVVFTVWSCQSGDWQGSCVSPPGSTFTHPITLRFYYFNGEVAGNKFYEQTHTFAIPYRPSADPTNCPLTPSKWFDAASGKCRNGFNTVLEFDLTDQGTLNLPQEIVAAVAFNTRSYGDPSPIGGASGPYDSLNVACPYAQDMAADGWPMVQIGSTGALFWDSTYPCAGSYGVDCNAVRVPCGSQQCTVGNRERGMKQSDAWDQNDYFLVARIE